MSFSYYCDIIGFEHSCTYLAKIGVLNLALNMFQVSKKDTRTTSMFPFYTPWQYQTCFGLLMFSEDIEKVHGNVFSYFIVNFNHTQCNGQQISPTRLYIFLKKSLVGWYYASENVFIFELYWNFHFLWKIRLYWKIFS